MPHPNSEGHTAGLVYHPRCGVDAASIVLYINPRRACTLKRTDARAKAGTRSINPAINQSTNQSINQSINQLCCSVPLTQIATGVSDNTENCWDSQVHF
jgi:hypothetical protein